MPDSIRPRSKDFLEARVQDTEGDLSEWMNDVLELFCLFLAQLKFGESTALLQSIARRLGSDIDEHDPMRCLYSGAFAAQMWYQGYPLDAAAPHLEAFEAMPEERDRPQLGVMLIRFFSWQWRIFGTEDAPDFSLSLALKPWLLDEDSSAELKAVKRALGSAAMCDITLRGSKPEDAINLATAGLREINDPMFARLQGELHLRVVWACLAKIAAQGGKINLGQLSQATELVTEYIGLLELSASPPLSMLSYGYISSVCKAERDMRCGGDNSRALQHLRMDAEKFPLLRVHPFLLPRIERLAEEK